MKTMIYRAFSLMLFCLALVSCKDDFDIQKLQDHPRLVVYCFPTEGDTTLVSVAKSLPVASVKGNVDILSREKVDAHIIYKVNGVEQTVEIKSVSRFLLRISHLFQHLLISQRR